MIGTFLARLASWPRNRYLEDGHNLDLAFITSQICVMSLPSVSWPERLYRNDLLSVKKLLDGKAHGRYRVFDFRAEGAGYDDVDFDHRVSHFPFVDHHPPPFKLLPKIVDALHDHLTSPAPPPPSGVGTSRDEGDGLALAVIHCKAGKGRSGLSTCSYLVTHEHWREDDARALFTAKRMRSGFGEGVSIPSQRRYLRYVERWARSGRLYQDQRVRIDKIEVVGLKSGCQLSLRHFQKDGAEIATLHDFSKRDEISTNKKETTVLTPREPLVMDSDVCVYLSQGTAFAHFWFNTYFEGQDDDDDDKTFTIAWEEVDGWKGTKWRGTQAYKSITVYWSVQ